MRARRLLLLAVGLGVVGAGTACGAHDRAGAGAPPVPGTGAGGGRLVITTDAGLRLRPADGHRVAVDDRVDAAWSHRSRTWTLDLSCPDRPRHGSACPRMPYVKVPDGFSVTVSARNAGVDAAGVDAALDLATVNGDVTVTRSGHDDATVRLSTRNGSVRATDLDAGRLRAATTNGDVILACTTAPSDVTAVTANGSVQVTVPHTAPAYRVTADTVNGRATTAVPERNAGRGPTMTLTTVNGDIEARTE
ncbi:DUF4097 family beta strand repeat-containing protein [Streptomyces sp. NPDC005648]|uniref:DUF4097 family beta strand repeat-containing protein n=1 Tax=Streptomyces sp. NPDC005648 TaxID=3157044 RepID=UPI0033BD663B